MKLIKFALALLLVLGIGGLAGCKKKTAGSPTDLPPMEVEGVKVELPKLVQSLTTGSQEAQASVRNVQMAFRYRQFEKALMDMDKLVNDPSLTEDQKKLANEVLEQVKQVATKAPSAPGPGQ